MIHTRFLVAVAAVLAMAAARADDKISIGCTATTDCASAIVAIDEGIFKKHGIDARMVLIGINSNIPAAIASNSVQIGGPTSSVFLQAVDGGLDLVGVAGASIMSEYQNRDIVAFVRNDVRIKGAKDFVGKKVAAPGLNTFTHILFVKWLHENGVNPKSVSFVEASFPTMADILKGGSVDAVLTVQPFLSRVEQAGIGYVGAYYVEELKFREPIIFYAASRAWTKQNPDLAKRFRAAVQEGAALVNADREKTWAALSRFTKQPIELVRNARPSFSAPNLTPAGLSWWIDTMSTLGMLQGKPEVSRLIDK